MFKLVFYHITQNDNEQYGSPVVFPLFHKEYLLHDINFDY